MEKSNKVLPLTAEESAYKEAFEEDGHQLRLPALLQDRLSESNEIRNKNSDSCLETSLFRKVDQYNTVTTIDENIGKSFSSEETIKSSRKNSLFKGPPKIQRQVSSEETIKPSRKNSLLKGPPKIQRQDSYSLGGTRRTASMIDIAKTRNVSRSSLSTAVSNRDMKSRLRSRESAETLCSRKSGMNIIDNKFEQFDGEVKSGCLSKELTTHLAYSAMGNSAHKISGTHLSLYITFLLIGIPTLVGITYVIPLSNPYSRSFNDHLLFYFLVNPLQSFVIYTGLGLYVPIVTNLLYVSWRNVMIFICVGSVTQVVVLATVGYVWISPVPMGFILAQGTSLFVAFSLFLYVEFGWDSRHNNETIKRIVWQTLPVFLSIAFLLIFSLYNYAFSSLSAYHQALIAPIWSAVKIGFKIAVRKALVNGKNPDAAPFAATSYELMAAMCGKLLFISCSDIRSVLIIISIDLAENLYMTNTALSYFQRYYNSKGGTSGQISIGTEIMIRTIVEERLEQESIQLRYEYEELFSRIEEIQKILNISSAENSFKSVRTHANDKSFNTKSFNTLTEQLISSKGSIDVSSSSFINKNSINNMAQERDKSLNYASLQQRRQVFPTSENQDNFSKESIRKMVVEGAGCDINYSRGLYQILNLVLKEVSEVTASCWTMILCTFLYFGPNKPYILGIENLDGDGFESTMWFAFLDAVSEMILGILLLVAIKLYTRIHVTPLVAVYFKQKRYLGAYLAIGFAVLFTSLGVFLKHFGIDPTLKFTWLNESKITSASTQGG